MRTIPDTLLFDVGICVANYPRSVFLFFFRNSLHTAAILIGRSDLVILINFFVFVLPKLHKVHLVRIEIDEWG